MSREGTPLAPHDRRDALGSRAQARASSGQAAPAASVERALLASLHRLAGAPPVQLRLWDGSTAGDAAAPYTLELLDRRALYELLRNPNIGFGDL